MTYHEWIIAQHLVRTTKESFYRWYDRHGFNKIVRANYFSPKGIPLDVQAEDISEIVGSEEWVTPDDLVTFILSHRRNPWSRKKKPDFDSG